MDRQDVKRIIIRIAGAAVAVCVLIAALYSVTSLLERKESEEDGG